MNKQDTRAPARSRDQVESELLDLVIRLGVAGLAPGPTFVGCAVSQVLNGRCSIEQVEQITVEFLRRRRNGDKALRTWQDLFFAKNWARTAHDYLGIESSRASPAALEASQQEWDRKRELVLLQGGAGAVPGEDEPSPDWSRVTEHPRGGPRS